MPKPEISKKQEKIEKKVLPTEIVSTKEKDFISPPMNNNKHDETAEVLKLFNSPHSIKSLGSKKKIEQDAILPGNISNISLFSQKDKEKTGVPFFNSKASFTKVKGLSVQESIRKEEGQTGAIFNYQK